MNCYFIAEIGINHNGRLDYALTLIDRAIEAGCNCVKFQKRNPDLCVPEEQKFMTRFWKNKSMTYLEYKKDIEFGEAEYDVINAYCKYKGIEWTVSVWDVDSVEFMKKYIKDIPFIKIPSACITDLELIQKVNELGVPVLISNGMSSQKEVDVAIEKIENLFGILHCNSSYPACEYQLDLNVINEYKKRYKDILIGYSGHEIGIKPTLIAAALGADIIERHITTSHHLEGSDHECSLEIQELKNLINEIKYIENIKGNNYLTVYPEEEKVKEKLRKN